MSEDHRRRPSILSKRTHIRAQKHQATFPVEVPTAPRTLDRIIACIGYSGVAYHIFSNYKRLNPWEIAGLSLGSLTLGYGLFDLGKRNGIIQGASFALRNDVFDEEDEERERERVEKAWEKQFRGKEYEELKTAEKIAWLRKEESVIREVQADEQLRCGQAYIKKEEAYVEYEKRGGYGGEAWKTYAAADKECQDMYNKYEELQERVRSIRREINELSEAI